MILKKEDDIKEQFNRIRIFFQKETIDEAFKVLNIPKSTYSNYYNREKLPSKLISQLRDEHYMNPEWLKTGKGTMRVSPTPSELFQAKHTEEPQNRYGTSECMMVCDAIKRRDAKYTEELVAKVLMYINSLDIPLANSEDNLEKKE